MLCHVYARVCCTLLSSDRQVRRKKKKAGSRRCDFTEGWVEFRDKRIAKRVAASLNNTPMGTRKRQRFFSDLWSIKVQSAQQRTTSQLKWSENENHVSLFMVKNVH